MIYQAKVMSTLYLVPYSRGRLANYSRTVPNYDIIKGTHIQMDGT
jgi:hypothetical protein